jgi:superoxide dismutase, Cu-Zn family
MGRTSTSVLLATIVCMVGAAGAAAEPPRARPAFSRVDFAPYWPGSPGVTYDEALVPVGSDATVRVRPVRDRTVVRLRVRDLVPGREYGAHVHQNPCGATGDAAGPHYQHVPDPVQPSVDPAYANPRNEIWLDFTTDRSGDATVSSTVDWQFTDRHAGSVVIHAEHTHTGPGHAGTAGTRLACVTVGF